MEFLKKVMGKGELKDGTKELAEALLTVIVNIDDVIEGSPLTEKQQTSLMHHISRASHEFRKEHGLVGIETD